MWSSRERWLSGILSRPVRTTVTDFAVREARRQDAGAVAALWKQMMDFHGEQDARFRFRGDAVREFERHFHDTLHSRDAHLSVADAGGQVIGYVLGEIHARKPLYPVGRYGFVSDISVSEEWRRRGVGRAMVNDLMEWFRRRGVTAVELFVAEANPVSSAFWQEMGFAPFLRLVRKELT